MSLLNKIYKALKEDVYFLSNFEREETFFNSMKTLKDSNSFSDEFLEGITTAKKENNSSIKVKGKTFKILHYKVHHELSSGYILSMYSSEYVFEVKLYSLSKSLCTSKNFEIKAYTNNENKNFYYNVIVQKIKIPIRYIYSDNKYSK